MCSFRLLLLGGVSLLFAGCSIHPLPEHVTPLNTVEIVQQVRCEARDAIFNQLTTLLEKDRIPELQTLAADLRAEPAYIQQVIKDYDAGLIPLPDDTKALIDTYRGAALGLGFAFDITEQNKTGTDFDFRDPLLGGVLDVSFNNGLDVTRRTDRQLTVADSFQTLLENEELIHICKGRHFYPSAIYPVTGSIGLAEVIRTFIRIANTAEISEQFKDTIEFETRAYGSVDPVVTLMPMSPNFELTGVTGNLHAERKDIHKVIVSVAEAKKEEEPKKVEPLQIRIVSVDAPIPVVPQAPGTLAPRTAAPPGTAPASPRAPAAPSFQLQRAPAAAVGSAVREAADTVTEELNDDDEEDFRRALDDLNIE